MENRRRGKNFTSEEILLLAELVGKNRSVIENTQSGAVTHKQKEAVWQKLTASHHQDADRKIEEYKKKIHQRNKKKVSFVCFI
jgi:hypothetical protein